MRLLRKFLALEWAARWLLVEAWLYLGAARLALLSIPFRRLAVHLGPQMIPADARQWSGTTPQSARQVAWAVDLMSRHTPWESACLAQAIAGKFMLARRQVPALLYLGTRTDESGHLTAHAWLGVAGHIVLGGAGHEGFTPLAAFGPARLNQAVDRFGPGQ